MAQNKYDALGVSASKQAVHAALREAGLKESSGLFANIVDDLSGDPQFASFLHADGAGTKSIVAYLLYKETGDASVFAGLAQDALAMNLDDVFCLGVPSSLVLGNAIARNASIIPGEVISVLVSAYAKLCKQLADFEIPISFSGGETADCGDVVRSLVVDATLGGRIPRKALIDQNRIAPGDVIVGLASTGKANYETEINSGIGSNGLTLARHSLLSKYHCEKYGEVVDPSLAAENTFRGPFKVTDATPGLPLSIGKALLSPTRMFAPVLLKIYQRLGTNIHGAIHVTGGGLTKVLRFGKGNLVIKNNLFPVPPLFQLIQQHGNVSWREMYQVFNMGHRLELYVGNENVPTIIEIARSFEVEGKVIGFVERNPENAQTNKVRVEGPHGKFDYELPAG